jgi:hypothetical protein
MQLAVPRSGSSGGGQHRDMAITSDGRPEPIERARQRLHAEDPRARKQLTRQERELAVVCADVDDRCEIVAKRNIAVLDRGGDSGSHRPAPRGPLEQDEELAEFPEASFTSQRDHMRSSER